MIRLYTVVKRKESEKRAERKSEAVSLLVDLCPYPDFWSGALGGD